MIQRQLLHGGDPCDYGPIFTIVVHGTALAGKKGTWWKRLPNNDYPFCKSLGSELRAYGVLGEPWRFCGQLGVAEFEWSGKNDHATRVRAGAELAAYVNRLNEVAPSRLGKKPIFLFVAHSHGGNVVSSSLGHLASDVAILGIHYLGTPFFHYDDRPASERDHWAPGVNIYMSGPTRCPSTYIWVPANASGWIGTADEVETVFWALVENLDNFKRVISDAWERLATGSLEPLVQSEAWYTFPFVLGDVEWITAATVLPANRKVRAARARNLVRRATAPLRRLLFRLSRKRVAQYVTTVLYEHLTGLNAHQFEPDRMRITAADAGLNNSLVSFYPLNASWRPSTEPDNANPTADALTALIGRIREALSGLTLFHSAYYSTATLISEIAKRTADNLLDSPFYKLLDRVAYKEKTGTTVTWDD